MSKCDGSDEGAAYLECEARPLAVGGHQLLEGRVFLDLELHDVPVLSHHLQVDVLGVGLVLCLARHDHSRQVTLEK